MSPALPKVRELLAHEWPTYRDLRLRALSESPDAFCATLAQATSIDWQGRVAAGCASPLDRPIVVDVGGISVGLAWGKVSPDALERADIFQMWVDPEFRGRGVASLLVEDLLTWARDLEVRCVCLGVTCGDSPARRLYESAGFLPVGQPEAMRPGSPLLFQTMRYDLESAG